MGMSQHASVSTLSTHGSATFLCKPSKHQVLGKYEEKTVGLQGHYYNADGAAIDSSCSLLSSS